MISLTVMRKLRWFLLAIAAMSFARGGYASTPEKHPARGIVLTISPDKREIEVSCDEIPGYMAAMAMPFLVRDAGSLDHVSPGMAIKFSMVVQGKSTYAQDIHPDTTKSSEPEPMEAGSLAALNSIINPSGAKREIAIGAKIPDFALTDQAGKEVRLSDLKGKVVALTFGYSRCPNPNYCYRLSNNLERVERRFHDRGGKDLVLLTVAIDPQHDQGATLAEYANSFHASVIDWHFLTGSLTDVKQVAELFGMNFWNSEGLLTHSLHTVIIDRNGKLATNLEGNQFTAKQLGDLVQVELSRR
jgi:protein SCO1